jgi:predicted RNase H-like HicB family nuclease
MPWRPTGETDYYFALVKQGEIEWVAIHPESSIVSQGPTEEKALANLASAIEETIIFYLKRNNWWRENKTPWSKDLQERFKDTKRAMVEVPEYTCGHEEHDGPLEYDCPQGDIIFWECPKCGRKGYIA